MNRTRLKQNRSVVLTKNCKRKVDSQYEYFKTSGVIPMSVVSNIICFFVCCKYILFYTL